MHTPNYSKLTTLHKGYNSKIYLIQINQQHSENYNPNKPPIHSYQVVKKYFKKKSESLLLQDLNEYAIMHKLSHQNIIKFNSAFSEQLPLKNHICLTIDLMMPLNVLLTDKQFKSFLTPQLIPSVMLQLCQALRYLHENGIIHRDIKPSNIFIDREGVVKLGDMGISRKIGANMTSQVCTKNYRAPELFFGDKDYDFCVDIWSLGCTLSEMYLQSMLFNGRSEIEILTQITQLIGPLNDQVWPKCSQLPMFLEFVVQGAPTFHNKLSQLPPEAITLIEQMMQLNPQKRATIQQLLDNPYFNNVQQETNQLKDSSVLYTEQLVNQNQKKMKNEKQFQ